MGLKQQAVKGVVWNSVGTIGSGVINLLITMILARLLSPDQFGVIAILTAFSLISDVIVDSGFSQAIIRDQSVDNTKLTSVFYFNLFIAIILYIFLFLLSPSIAFFYKIPEIKIFSRVLFLSVILNSLGLIQTALFNRDINFKAPAISSIVSMIIAGITSAIMAYRGFGIWALIANSILFAGLRSLLLWIQSSWRPKGFIKIESLKEYFGFSSNLLVQGLIDRIVTNIEPILIGKFYTTKSLGYFSQASKFYTYISATSSSVLQKVSYPVLSKIADNQEHLKSAYSQLVSLVIFALLPVYIVVILYAEDIMIVFFGSQWGASTPFLRLWSVCGFSLSIYSLFTNIFLVKGKTRQYLKLFIIKQIIRLTALLITIRISVMGIMWGIAIVTVFTGLMYTYYGGKLIDFSLRDFGKILFQPVISSAIALFIIYLFQNLFHLQVGRIVVLIIGASAFLFIYFACMLVMKNSVALKLLSTFKTFLGLTNSSQ